MTATTLYCGKLKPRKATCGLRGVIGKSREWRFWRMASFLPPSFWRVNWAPTKRYLLGDVLNEKSAFPPPPPKDSKLQRKQLEYG